MTDHLLQDFVRLRLQGAPPFTVARNVACDDVDRIGGPLEHLPLAVVSHETRQKYIVPRDGQYLVPVPAGSNWHIFKLSADHLRAIIDELAVNSKASLDDFYRLASQRGAFWRQYYEAIVEALLSGEDDDLKSFAMGVPRWYVATSPQIHSYLRVTHETENEIHGELYLLWVDGPKRGDLEHVGQTYIKKDYPENWKPASGFTVKRIARRIARNESIAIDLDGVLACDSGWKGADHIGEPIQKTVDFVNKLLDGGEEVVIFTARCHDGKKSTKDYVKDWLKDNGLPDLEVTNEKRPDMEFFVDDKAIEVETNSGEVDFPFRNSE